LEGFLHELPVVCTSCCLRQPVRHACAGAAHATPGVPMVRHNWALHVPNQIARGQLLERSEGWRAQYERPHCSDADDARACTHGQRRRCLPG